MRVNANTPKEMKFSDVLRRASRMKERRGLSPELTRAEFKKLREAYEAEKRSNRLSELRKAAARRRSDERRTVNSRISEAKGPYVGKHAPRKEDDAQYTAACKKLSELKRRDGLSGIITRSESEEIKKQLKEFNTLRQETIREYRKVKIEKGLSPVVTEKERAMLLEAQKENDRKSFKESDAAKRKLHEARLAVYRAKRALKEGDLNAAGQNVQDASNAVQAVDAASNALPQNIVDSIANIKASIEDLAAQAGIEASTDLGANPAADVPPVADQPAEEPAPANLTESKDKLAEVKARIASREKALSKIKEDVSTAGKFGKAVLADVGAKLPDGLAGEDRNVDKKDDASTLDLPTKSELAEGSDKDATKWPTEKAKGLPTTLYESEAEKYVDKKLQEAEEQKNWNWNKILQAGILG